MEGAEAGAIADDMVRELLELGCGGARVDEGCEDGLEAVDVGGGEARVDEGGLEAGERVVGADGDGLEVGVVAGVAEGGGGMDCGRDLGGRVSEQ